jgi:hypothetical protein
MDQLLPEPEKPSFATPPRRGFHLLQTGLLVAGSALLGGLAVALWHRNSLAKLRQPVPAEDSASVQQDAEDE